MPGLRIMHYVLDAHYSEPTRVYMVVQQANSDLTMEKLYEFRAESVEDMAGELNHIMDAMAVRRPVVLVDPYLFILEYLKSKGFRVR